METLKFKAIINGPQEYLPGCVKVEDFEISEEDIQEFLNDGDGTETREDAISYYKEEYMNEWGQRWCTANLIPLKEYEEKLKMI